VLLRFDRFEFDSERAELRGPDGEVVRLRPKALAMLSVLVASAGRTLSKQELTQAVWPNIHVGEDSLFQCIREIRAALGDNDRQLIRLVSGRGYLFEAEVVRASEASNASATPNPSDAAKSAAGRRHRTPGARANSPGLRQHAKRHKHVSRSAA